MAVTNKKLFFFTYFLVMVINLVTAQSPSEEWNGWRGLEKQGKQINSTVSLDWDTTKNIAWKTFIPGKGHSSPVVSGNNVIVTTAVKNEPNKLVTTSLKYLIIFINLLIIIHFSTLIYHKIISKSKASLQSLISILAMGMILAAATYLTQKGILFERAPEYHHTDVFFQWCFSFVNIFLWLAYAHLHAKGNIVTNLSFAGLFIVLAFIMYVFRPHPGYYVLETDWFYTNVFIHSLILPASIISLLFLLSFLSKKHFFNSRPFYIPLNFSLKTIFIATIIGAIVIGGYGYGLYRSLQYTYYDGEPVIANMKIASRDTILYFRFLYVAIFLWFISSAFFHIKHHTKITKLLAIALVVLMFSIFVSKNFLPKSNSYDGVVICLDAETGNIKWENKLFTEAYPNIHGDNSPATPTPVISKNKIYAYFGSPGLFCLDMDGKIIFKNTQLPFKSVHGIGASPMLYQNSIIILNDQAPAPYIAAIDKNNGKIIWKTNRKSWEGIHGVHQTPSIFAVRGTDYIICQGFYGLSAYKAETGEEVNSVKLLSHTEYEHVASIITDSATAYISTRKYMFAFDTKKLISADSALIWKTRVKNRGHIYASPILHNQMIFSVSGSGNINCINSKTGKVLWHERIPGRYYASAVLINDNIFFTNLSGKTTIYQGSAEKRKVCTSDLHEPIYASFAVTKNSLFIRSLHHIWRIE